MTLLHEAGHAFHAFAVAPPAAHLAAASRARRRPSWPRCPWSCWPRRTWRSRSGYFSPEDHRGAWLEHLEDILLSLVAHRVGGRVPDLDLHQRRGRRTPRRATRPGSGSGAASSGGWTGAASSSERVARWYRQLHIFLYPFYYIEYGIAQLGALQVWRNSLRDPARAVAALSRGAGARRGAEPARDVPRRGRRAQRSMRDVDRRAGRAGGGTIERSAQSAGPSSPERSGELLQLLPGLRGARFHARSSRRRPPAVASRCGEPGWPRKKESRWRGS